MVLYGLLYITADIHQYIPEKYFSVYFFHAMVILIHSQVLLAKWLHPSLDGTGFFSPISRDLNMLWVTETLKHHKTNADMLSNII